ncbi:AMP-binding protein [Caulobacter sp. 17J80-11]|uniref:AMP-binding protein n=1 Tax=Caulobacter sp. 17J80-11 TaxID=2763502 RepID=UPI0016537D50|nr:AMP-binding protein [Caulobacter sp. 17J80-11]MBC6980799.1 AMP-binding protein [Caulobacter sp. 17J80-11]
MPRAFDAREGERPVFDALLDARARFGGHKEILEDQDRKPLTYTGLIRAAFVLGRKIADMTAPQEHVGVLLPSSMGVVVTYFGLHAFGRVPVMLNFTAGSRNLKAALAAAGVTRVLTAKRFVETAKLDDLIADLKSVAEIVWLDDIRSSIKLKDKLFGLAAGFFPKLFRTPTSAKDPGVILFTSGSFGMPKGVVLSQANLVSNVRQIEAHIDLDPHWVMFNPLPTFHCLGLTGGVLLPLLTGMKAFEYPSPLHTKQIPQLMREAKASILLATDTFVNQYARAGTPEDFASLQFVVCGAEKVRDETHELFARDFNGLPVLEGYGATEASPVIAVNQPNDNRRGTVGKLLPGIETRVEPVEGIPHGGVLHVRGANVMAGYLHCDGSKGIDEPADGWYDTGDVVEIDREGVVRILGRVKRFAKIGGEMVSLTAVEGIAEAVWPDGRHAVVSIPDKKKGERLVLVTDRTDAEVASLTAWARRHGAPELAVPKKILKVSEVPVLGTGKTDYVAIQQMVELEAEAA